MTFHLNEQISQRSEWQAATHLCIRHHLQSICLAVGGSGLDWMSSAAKPWSFSLQPVVQNSCCYLEGGANILSWWPLGAPVCQKAEGCNTRQMTSSKFPGQQNPHLPNQQAVWSTLSQPPLQNEWIVLKNINQTENKTNTSRCTNTHLYQ